MHRAAVPLNVSPMRAGRPPRSSPALFGVPIFRLAAVTAALLVALLLAAAVYAQGAYPGEALYAWKLAGENLARLVDPIGVDMWLSQRRTDEVLAVRTDPARLAIALEQYRLVMERLQAYDDPRFQEAIRQLLQAQALQFAQFGISLSGTAASPPALPTPTPTPTATSTTATPSPSATPTLPPDTPTPTLSGPAAPTRTPFAFPTLRPLPTLRPPPCLRPGCR